MCLCPVQKAACFRADDGCYISPPGWPPCPLAIGASTAGAPASQVPPAGLVTAEVLALFLFFGQGLLQRGNAFGGIAKTAIATHCTLVEVNRFFGVEQHLKRAS